MDLKSDNKYDIFEALVKIISTFFNKQVCMRVEEFNDILTGLYQKIEKSDHAEIIEKKIMDRFDGEVVNKKEKDETYDW
jgi:hypothetical protein|tara:strand:+ start:1365 stop:1601 length:237 start_codon:yes stop_codon:yes gene_type:complete